MHLHAFSMYISVGMLNRIHEQVPVMSQLTASQSSCHCTPWQLHDNAAALTSSLHHRHYIRSCQTSLSMLLNLCLTANNSVPDCQPLHRINTFLSRNCYFASPLRLRENPHRTVSHFKIVQQCYFIHVFQYVHV